MYIDKVRLLNTIYLGSIINESYLNKQRENVMGNNILRIPLTEQTKEYLEKAEAFFKLISQGNFDMVVFFGHALILFENYLDLLYEEKLVVGFSCTEGCTFHFNEVLDEMYKPEVEVIHLIGITQDFFDLLERLKEKSIADSHSEVAVLAISYFAFLVQVFEDKGETFVNQKTGKGNPLKFYNVDLFDKNRQLMH